MSRLKYAQVVVCLVAVLAILSNASGQSSPDRGRLLDEIDMLRKEVSKKEAQPRSVDKGGKVVEGGRVWAS